MSFVRFFRILAILAALAQSAPVLAQTAIPGQDGPAYGQAVEAWLSGRDDLAALRQISALANDGNTAAQILLGRIAGHAHLTAHVTEPLDRADRIALLRQPGGLSGRSWLEPAADTAPLARALLDSADRAARAGAIVPLIEAGESAIATRAIATLFNNGQGDRVAEIVNSGVLLPPEAALLYATVLVNGGLEQGAYSGSALVSPTAPTGGPPALALTWSPVPPRTLLEDPTARAYAIAHSEHVPAFRPLAELCRARCPGEVAQCSAAGAAELWVADTFPFASPSQALIPDAVYWASDRIEADVLRRLGNDRQTEWDWNFYKPVSACFARMMTDWMSAQGG